MTATVKQKKSVNRTGWDIYIDNKLKYSGNTYYNNFGTWTGIVNDIRSGYSLKLVRRSGYETREDALAYVDRWLAKLTLKELKKYEKRS